MPAQEKLGPGWSSEDTSSFRKVADDVFAPIYPCLARDVAIALGRPFAGLAVLEIGGGVGNMALELLRTGVTSLADLDISSSMLGQARERLERFPNLSKKFFPFQGEAGRLPFRASSFDLVFSRGSIMFWPDIPCALREIKRVLAPGGMAYLGGGLGISTPPEVVQGILESRAGSTTRNDRPDSPFPTLDHDELRDAAAVFGGTASVSSGKGGFWLVWFPGGSA